MALKTNSPSVISLASTLAITRTRALALLRRCSEDINLAIDTYYSDIGQTRPQSTDQSNNQSNNQSDNQSNNQSNDLPNNLPVDQPASPPVDQSVTQSNGQSISLSANQASNNQLNNMSNYQSGYQAYNNDSCSVSSLTMEALRNTIPAAVAFAQPVVHPFSPPNQSINQSSQPSFASPPSGMSMQPTSSFSQPIDQSSRQPVSQSNSQPINHSNGQLNGRSPEPQQPIQHTQSTPLLSQSASSPKPSFTQPSDQSISQSNYQSHNQSNGQSYNQSNSHSNSQSNSQSNIQPVSQAQSLLSLDMDRFIRGEDSYLASSNSAATDAARQFEAKRIARSAIMNHSPSRSNYTVKQEKPQVSTGLFSSERSSSLFSPRSVAATSSVKAEPRSMSSISGIKSELNSTTSPSSYDQSNHQSNHQSNNQSNNQSVKPNKPRDSKLTVTITDESPNAPYPSMIVRLIPLVNFEKVYRMFESKNYVNPKLSFLGVDIQRTDIPQDLDIFDGAELDLKYQSIRQLPVNPPSQAIGQSNSQSNNQSRVKRERDDDDWNASCSDKRVKVDDDDDASNNLPSPSSDQPSVHQSIPSIPEYEDTTPWFKTLLLGTLELSFRSMGLDKLEKKQLEWSKFEQLVYSGLLMIQPESTRNWQAISTCCTSKPSYFDITVRLVQTNKVAGVAAPDNDSDDMSNSDDSMDDSDDDMMGMFGRYSRYRRRPAKRRKRAGQISSMLSSLLNSVSAGLISGSSLSAGLNGAHHFVHQLKFDIALKPAAMGSSIEGMNELLHLTIGNKFDRLRKAAFGSMHNKVSAPPMDITSILALAQRKSFIAKLLPASSASSSMLARIKRENEEEKGDAVVDNVEDQPFEQRALAYLRSECESGDHDWPTDWLTSSDGVLDPSDFSDMCHSRLILRDYQLQSVLWMLGQELSPSIAAPFWTTMIVDGQQMLYSPLLQAFRTGPLEDTRGGLLCDSMGLGKTISIMALANLHPAPSVWLSNEPNSKETKTRSRATLIIAPSSLVGQWVAELNKASMKSPKMLCYYGSTRPSNAWIVADNDFVLTTPDVLANDMEGRRGASGPLFAVEWWRVIVDEGHTLKDLNTKRSRACRALKSQQRFLLTGTPMSSALSNLHGLFAFLHIKAIGDWNPLWTSIDQVANGSRQRRNTQSYQSANVYRLLEIMMTQLCMRHTKDAPFNGRRDLIELPPIHMANIKINFTPEQKAAYQELDEFARKKFDALVTADQLRAKTIVALSYLLPARQACAGGVMDMAEQRRKEQLAQQQLDAIQAARVRADPRAYAAAYDDSDDEGGNAGNDDPSNVRRYPVAKHPPFNELTDECTICLSEFSLPLQTSCNHLYCADCVLQLIAHSPSGALCPQCRAHLSRNKLFQPLKPRPPTPPPVVADAAPDAIVKDEEKKEEKKTESNMVIFDSKLRVLLDHLLIDQQQSPAVKCLVFTQFTSTLQWIESALKARGIKTFKITGDMSMTRRTRILQQFNQSNEFTVFLLSIRVGAVGLTLTAASRVYLCEPCLNPSLTLQAIGRVCRLGQRNEVQIKQLVMRDSVEERIEAIVKDRLKDLHSHFSAAAQRPDDAEPELAANIGAISRDGSVSLQTQQLYTLFGRTL